MIQRLGWSHPSRKQSPREIICEERGHFRSSGNFRTDGRDIRAYEAGFTNGIAPDAPEQFLEAHP